MKVSVIIPTLNEEKYIGGILSDLQTQTQAPIEIIVVDAGSKDKTATVVSGFPHVKFIPSHPPVAYQRTTGGKHAGGDWLFFFDADVRVISDFISASLSHVQPRRLDIACPRYNGYRYTLLVSLFLYGLNGIFYLLQTWLPSGGGNCIIVKKSAFEKCGGFDPQIQFDDIEFIRRTARTYRFGIIPTCCYICDRRFRKYGFLRMVWTYSVLSIFFTLGLFRHTRKLIRYEFGKFDI